MSKQILTSGLKQCVRNCDVEAFQRYATQHVDELNSETPFGNWLHYAAGKGCLPIVKLLVESHGFDINVHGGIANSLPLECAAANGHVSVVEYLIQQGSKIDTDLSERNPLFSAIQEGSLDIVKLLVANGINYRQKYSSHTMNNMDAQGFAIERGESEIATYLASLGKG